MKKIYIIHGYAATPSDHWFQSTKQALEGEDIAVTILQMPNPMHPSLELWLAYLQDNLTDLDAETIIVAHSLGVITTLRYLLSLHLTVHLKGLVLVSGFRDNLANLPQLNEFTGAQLDNNKMRQLADRRIMFVSDNDQIVDPKLTTKFAKEIDAELHIVTGGGHFLTDDGYKEFSEIVDTVRSMWA